MNAKEADGVFVPFLPCSETGVREEKTLYAGKT